MAARVMPIESQCKGVGDGVGVGKGVGREGGLAAFTEGARGGKLMRGDV
jgi:hypothetical protein